MEYQEWYVGTEEMKMYMLLVCNVFSEGTVPTIWQETRAFCMASYIASKHIMPLTPKKFGKCPPPIFIASIFLHIGHYAIPVTPSNLGTVKRL
jgi:hypothetical protein